MHANAPRPGSRGLRMRFEHGRAINGIDREAFVEGSRHKPTDPPRTRTWNLRLRRPTPYPLGQRASACSMAVPLVFRFYFIFSVPAVAITHTAQMGRCNVSTRDLLAWSSIDSPSNGTWNRRLRMPTLSIKPAGQCTLHTGLLLSKNPLG